MIPGGNVKQTTLSASIGASGFAAACVVILTWLLGVNGVRVPPEVAAAFGTIVTAVTHFLAVVYFQPKEQKP